MNTSFNLMYRDEDNYKSFTDVVLSGEITDEQIAAIKGKMEDGCFIIAEQVGLPSPCDEMAAEYTFGTEADHVWTTVLAFDDQLPKAAELHTSDAPTVSLTVQEVVDAIMDAKWDETHEAERLDL